MFIGLQVGQVLFAPIPGEVTGFLGGYMFGALSGFLLSTVGADRRDPCSISGSVTCWASGLCAGSPRCETYREVQPDWSSTRGCWCIFHLLPRPRLPQGLPLHDSSG
ncbi:MAG: hypothetical protein MZV70_64255 [Desulfobacterales bacterium]|nr:hypothetical protein [Desulfobacterales bacterium]